MTTASSGPRPEPLDQFGAYADVYDLVYEDKDYASETSFVERLFKRHRIETHRVLDVAAGTGGHALLLAERGYEVIAQDISPSMADRTREKASARGLKLEINGGADMRTLPLPATPFDAVVCLFASVNYLLEAADLESFLAGVLRSLAPGGLFICDFWNGLACLQAHERVRVKEAGDGARRFLRVSETELFPMVNQAVVSFRFVSLGESRSASEIRETHRVRYFFPLEMAEAVVRSGLVLLELVPFLDETRAAQPSDWNVTLVARRNEE
ncbi:MAG: class I SAM-dependent methyltransferase [Thermoanaerobaculia bacterium]